MQWTGPQPPTPRCAVPESPRLWGSPQPGKLPELRCPGACTMLLHDRTPGSTQALLTMMDSRTLDLGLSSLTPHPLCAELCEVTAGKQNNSGTCLKWRGRLRPGCWTSEFNSPSRRGGDNYRQGWGDAGVWAPHTGGALHSAERRRGLVGCAGLEVLCPLPALSTLTVACLAEKRP